MNKAWLSLVLVVSVHTGCMNWRQATWTTRVQDERAVLSAPVDVATRWARDCQRLEAAASHSALAAAGLAAIGAGAIVATRVSMDGAADGAVFWAGATVNVGAVAAAIRAWAAGGLHADLCRVYDPDPKPPQPPRP